MSSNVVRTPSKVQRFNVPKCTHSDIEEFKVCDRVNMNMKLKIYWSEPDVMENFNNLLNILPKLYLSHCHIGF